jgi:hypothetical protein
VLAGIPQKYNKGLGSKGGTQPSLPPDIDKKTLRSATRQAPGGSASSLGKYRNCGTYPASDQRLFLPSCRGVRLIQDRFAGNMPAVSQRFQRPGAFQFDGANLNEEGAMPKQESRAAVQVCSVIAPDDVAGLYVLASDATIWKYSQYKDLFYWQPLEPLPSEEDPGSLPRDDVARHKALCDALRQLGANIGELTTAEVVTACRAAVPDADSDEIMAALRASGRPV